MWRSNNLWKNSVFLTLIDLNFCVDEQYYLNDKHICSSGKALLFRRNSKDELNEQHLDLSQKMGYIQGKGASCGRSLKIKRVSFYEKKLDLSRKSGRKVGSSYRKRKTPRPVFNKVTTKIARG